MSEQQETKIQHVIETLILVVCSSCSYGHLIFQPSFNLTKSKYVNLGPKRTNHILTIRFPNSSFKINLEVLMIKMTYHVLQFDHWIKSCTE